MRITFGTNRFNFLESEGLIESAIATEKAGFDHLWFPDSQLHVGDVFVNMLVAARHTEHARVGTLIVNPITRHPSVIAGSIAALDTHLPGRFMLGIGSGDTAVIQVGLKPARLSEMERAVRMVHALLAGDEVDLGWTAPSRLDRPRKVPVLVATSGPKTLRMAGRWADGVVIRAGADAALLQWAYDEFSAGAIGAGRDPKSLFVAAHFHTVITDDPGQAQARGRVMAAGYYEVNRLLWERIGLRWPCAPIEHILKTVRPDFHHAVDMELAARMVAEIPIETARRFCLMGSGAEVRGQLERLLIALPWVRHVVLQPSTPGKAFVAACREAVIPAFL